MKLKNIQLIFVCMLSLYFLLYLNTATADEPTLKEKIGQMLLFGFKDTELHADNPIVHALQDQQVGGVILYDFDNSTGTYNHNIKNPSQLKQLTQQLQDYAKQTAEKKQNSLFPLLIGIDYEGGKVNRLKEIYGFPKTLSAAELGALSIDEAQQYAEQMAETLKAMGINLNFAPVVDVNVNAESPAIGRLGRSFSADPQKVIEYAALFSKAYQQHGILCTYKHFPGHGSALGDTHLGFVDVTETWKPFELDPYRILLSQAYSCPLIMTAHVVHFGLDSKGYPASISISITQDLLRQQLNFDGVVITDDMQMKAITDNYGLSEAIIAAINAGADILVFSNQLVQVPQNPADIVNIIYQDVMTGKIHQSRIEEAYQRIMKLKQQIKTTIN